MNHRSSGRKRNVRDLEFTKSTANHHGEYKFSRETNTDHCNVAIRKHGANCYLLKDIRTNNPKIIANVRRGSIKGYVVNGLRSNIVFVNAPRGFNSNRDRYEIANRKYHGTKYLVDVMSGEFKTVNSKPKFCGTHTSPDDVEMLVFKANGSPIVYNSSKNIFMSDTKPLEASDNMEEFEDKKAIIEASRQSDNINENDVIEGTPKDDLRDAHNITLEQYIERLQTAFGFTEEEAKKFINNDLDKNYPDDDLRDRFIDTMKRDEYEKILTHYHRVKESDGECPDELKKIDNIQRKLEDLESIINESDEITESKIDVREIQEAIDTINEIDDTIEESETLSENSGFL